MTVFPLTRIPITIPGICLWLDAVDPSNNGTQPLNNTTLATWSDKSGFNNNATQASGSAQPTYKTNQMNGLPSVSFNGTQSTMGAGTTNFPSGSGALTIFIVFNSTNIALDQYIVTWGINSAGHYFASAITGSSRVYADAGGASANGTTQLVSATNYITNINYPGGGLISTSSIIVNGVPFTVTSGSDGTPNTSVGTATIGSYLNGTLKLSGLLSEVLLYNRSLLPAQQTIINKYLGNKWGIPS